MSLHPTPHRRAFLRAVNERARIVRYHSTGDTYDNRESRLVNDRLREAFSAGWVEPIPEDELWHGAHPKTICSYYRLTAEGRRIIEEKK